MRALPLLFSLSVYFFLSLIPRLFSTSPLSLLFLFVPTYLLTLLCLSLLCLCLCVPLTVVLRSRPVFPVLSMTDKVSLFRLIHCVSPSSFVHHSFRLSLSLYLSYTHTTLFVSHTPSHAPSHATTHCHAHVMHMRIHRPVQRHRQTRGSEDCAD